MKTTTTTTKHHCHVVAMPYPGRGHINPMLNFCKLILSKSNSIFITFVVTQEWLGLLGSEVQNKSANLAFATVPQVIPSEIGRADDFPGFMEAVCTKLEEPFDRLLDRLEPKPVVIVYDLILSCWVVGVGNRRNISVASFVTFSATFFTVISHFDLLVKHGHFPLDVSERGSEVVDYIPGLPPTTIQDLPSIFYGNGNKTLHVFLQAMPALNKAQYILFNSIYEFEDQVIDVLKSKFNTPIYHIGPMIPYFNLVNDTIIEENIGHDYFQWLNSQPKRSVLYISQGSFLSASNEQVIEFIEGVKESNVRFLWVTRGDTKRFKNGVTSDAKGFFVPWCDQLRVLCHPSIGGFWTHCGWNSTTEGIYGGVPMLTSPLFWDQFPNSKMIVNDMKIGKRVINKKGELVTRKEIREIVRKFMDPKNEDRIDMLRRANEVKNTFRKAIKSGGSAASDLDAFISDIKGL